MWKAFHPSVNNYCNHIAEKIICWIKCFRLALWSPWSSHLIKENQKSYLNEQKWSSGEYSCFPPIWLILLKYYYCCFFCHSVLLYSWCFSHYRALIHWLVHGHMTSNDETVSRQMQWAGKIAKTMTSNGKQFTVTREMLTGVAHDQSIFQNLLLFCFESNHNGSRDKVKGNIEILRKQNSLFPLGPLLSVKYSQMKVSPSFEPRAIIRVTGCDRGKVLP